MEGVDCVISEAIPLLVRKKRIIFPKSMGHLEGRILSVTSMHGCARNVSRRHFV